MDLNRITLVFVYNADSGLFNLLTDIAHKAFSPKTYACNLCAITHSSFGMKNEWRQYLDNLNISFEFLHADELKADYQVVRCSTSRSFQNNKRSIRINR